MVFGTGTLAMDLLGAMDCGVETGWIGLICLAYLIDACFD